MMILKNNPQFQRWLIRSAVNVLRAGGVIAFPTETSYGLGCDPRNVKAAQRIYVIKSRPRHKFFVLVAGTVAQAGGVARLNSTAKKLAKTYWPGPLTLILPSRMHLPSSVAPRAMVGIRVSASPFVQALTRAYGFPIIATSANRSGQPDCYSGHAVARSFTAQKDQPDLIIDAGSLPRRKPSTIAKVHENGKIEVVRRGGVRIKNSPNPLL